MTNQQRINKYYWKKAELATRKENSLNALSPEYEHPILPLQEYNDWKLKNHGGKVVPAKRLTNLILNLIP